MHIFHVKGYSFNNYLCISYTKILFYAYFFVILQSKNKNNMSYTYEYPHPAVTTDCVVFGFDGTGLSVLLIKRGIEPFTDQWALPGGFIHIDETAEEGAYRELREETGIEDIYVEQLQAFTKVDRDPRERVITIAFTALVRQQDYGYIKGGDDAKEAKWFSVNDLPLLAFDHKEILDTALERLRSKIKLEPIAFHLLNPTFTMTQVQSIYEAVLGQKYDRRNFHKKMTVLGYIIPTGEKHTAYGRPGSLYTFDEEKYKEEMSKRSAI